MIVDDDVGRVSQRDEVEESAFGDTSREPLGRGRSAGRATRVLHPEPAPGAKTILVVDDEADIRRMLTRLLAKAGYRVIEADRGLWRSSS